MGDTTYMRFTVYDCPTKRKRAAELLAEYVSLPGWSPDAPPEDGLDPEEVVVGEHYIAEETSIGSIQYLAANLIADVPRCSFIGWEDPSPSGDGPVLGELIAYTPKLGRFSGECTGGGDVVLDRRQVDSALTSAAGWVGPSTYALDVAYGIPWVRHSEGARPPRALWRCWVEVIDRNYAAAQAFRGGRLGEHAANVVKLGLAEHAKVLLASDSSQPGDVLARLDDVRAVADECEAHIGQLAEPLRSPHWRVPSELRGWAAASEEAWQGRRRP